MKTRKEYFAPASLAELIGEPIECMRLNMPSPLLDLDIFEANVARMHAIGIVTRTCSYWSLLTSAPEPGLTISTA